MEGEVSETELSPGGHFDSLCERGRDQVERGRYVEALATYEEALDWSKRYGGRRETDLTSCYRASVLQALGRGEEIMAQMKRVLMASPDPASKYLAAYNVSMCYEDVQDYERGLFYARVACDHAHRGEELRFVVHSLNRLGNTLAAQSQFEEARERYTEALEVVGEKDSLDRAFVLDNLGYCHTVLGETTKGFAAIFAGLRMLRRLSLHTGETQMHLDLCYAYLEIGRLKRAEKHGLIALRGAEKLGDERQMKNGLYLLGDVAKLSGESRSAYAYFSRLQNEFYPDNGMIPHLLMTNDFRQMVNLRA